MSFFDKIFSGGEKVRKKKPCQQEETERRAEREELLMKKREFLRKKIDQELVLVKKNCWKNRKVALQALRRKKWFEKHLRYIDCAVKAMRSTHEHIAIVNKVNDLIQSITEEQDETQDLSDTQYSSLSFGVEFDEDELLAELERLEKNLDDGGFFEENRTEESVSPSKVSPPASPPRPAKTEEDEFEADLEHLRRWLNDCS